MRIRMFLTDYLFLLLLLISSLTGRWIAPESFQLCTVCRINGPYTWNKSGIQNHGRCLSSNKLWTFELLRAILVMVQVSKTSGCLWHHFCSLKKNATMIIEVKSKFRPWCGRIGDITIFFPRIMCCYPEGDVDLAAPSITSNQTISGKWWCSSR